MTDDQRIDAYLSQLRTNLGPMTLEDREEIVLEIRVHIRDSSEQSGATVSAVLEQLGPAEELARQYRDGLLVSKAGNSFSPLLLLHAAFRLAGRGVFGLLVFLCGLFGYALGAGLVLTSLLKPFLPAQTGLWVRDGHLVCIGTQFPAPQLPIHEVLGWMYIPAALCAGGLILALTSVAIRALLRVSKSFNAKLVTMSAFA